MYPNQFYRIKQFLKNKILFKSINFENNINFGSLRSNLFFSDLLKKSFFYFEFGSGSSSILAKKLGKKFISIECDKNFFNFMVKKKNIKNINFASIGPTLEYSYPLYISKNKAKNYISSIDKHFKTNNVPDLILVDGRFRVACCLNLLNFLEKINQKKTVILLDDYSKRSHYRILKSFFLIKEVGRMAILKPKSKKNFRNHLINFLSDPR
tara:strand:+ start:257 stop:886 length:630 start_codon:yes stop_codon:yes gene_type:complete